MLNKSLLPAFSVLLLGACSLAPELQKPEPPVAAEWNANGNANAGGARSIDNTPWQEFFPDPRLQALITASLEHNRDLRISVGRVEEARAAFGIARAARLPDLGIVGSRTASRSPGRVADTDNGEALYVDRYDAGVAMLSFELDFWGRVKNLSEAARANYLATEQAQRAFRLSLISDVAIAYFTLLEMEDRSAFALATVKSRTEAREILYRRREAGISGELDFLQADGALEFARADLANLERQRAAAANALVLLVGQPALDKSLPPGRRLTEQGVVADIKLELPSEVILKRPDVMAAEQLLIASNANIGAARAAFLPRISIAAGIGSAAHSMSNLFESNTYAWSFTPTIRQPLFGMGVIANLDLAEARKIIAVAEYEKSIQGAFREIADLLVAREQLARQLTSLEAAERAQTERLRLANARYDFGISNYLEVLDAQRDAYAAQQATIQTRRALLTAAAQLYKALGGGEAPPGSPSGNNTAQPAGTTG